MYEQIDQLAARLPQPADPNDFSRQARDAYIARGQQLRAAAVGLVLSSCVRRLRRLLRRPQRAPLPRPGGA